MNLRRIGLTFFTAGALVLAGCGDNSSNTGGSGGHAGTGGVGGTGGTGGGMPDAPGGSDGGGGTDGSVTNSCDAAQDLTVPSDGTAVTVMGSTANAPAML